MAKWRPWQAIRVGLALGSRVCISHKPLARSANSTSTSIDYHPVPPPYQSVGTNARDSPYTSYESLVHCIAPLFHYYMTHLNSWTFGRYSSSTLSLPLSPWTIGNVYCRQLNRVADERSRGSSRSHTQTNKKCTGTPSPAYIHSYKHIQHFLSMNVWMKG